MKKLFIIYLFLSYSCNFELQKGLPLRHSSSIKKSKSLNIYEHSYSSAYIVINDTIKFTIKEAWCEKSYAEADLNENNTLREDIKINNPYQIIFTTDENFSDFVGFNDNWRFNDMGFYTFDNTYHFCSYARGLVSKTPLSDTVEIKLQYSLPSKNLNEFNKIKPLGSFFLYKEK